jgi:hypothetical protein
LGKERRQPEILAVNASILPLTGELTVLDSVFTRDDGRMKSVLADWMS